MALMTFAAVDQRTPGGARWLLGVVGVLGDGVLMLVACLGFAAARQHSSCSGVGCAVGTWCAHVRTAVFFCAQAAEQLRMPRVWVSCVRAFACDVVLTATACGARCPMTECGGCHSKFLSSAELESHLGPCLCEWSGCGCSVPSLRECVALDRVAVRQRFSVPQCQPGVSPYDPEEKGNGSRACV